MGLKIKNFNIMGVHQFLVEGSHKKQYIGELPKIGLGRFAWGLAKKREDVFEGGGLIPRCTL